MGPFTLHWLGDFSPRSSPLPLTTCFAWCILPPQSAAPQGDPWAWDITMGPLTCLGGGVSAFQEGGGPGPLLPQPDAGEPEGEGLVWVQMGWVHGCSTLRHAHRFACVHVCAPVCISVHGWAGKCLLTRVRSQPKQFRKMIQQTFQQYALLREEECILKFLHTLSTFASIDQESYRCELIVSPVGGEGRGVVG